MRRWPVLAVAAFLLAAAGVAETRADEPPETGDDFQEDPTAADTVRRAAEGDADFGPRITIERIVIRGNSRTADRLIRRALLVQEGDSLHAGDPRLQTSRFRVLGLGFFTEVDLELERGTQRGQVVLTVDVVERGTATLRQLLWGVSEATPVWLGLDAGDTNLFGTGLSVSAAVLWAAAAELTGAEDQLALRLRLSDGSVLGTPLGWHARLVFNDASEPYRIAGSADDGSPSNFAAFSYSRAGGVAGVSWDLTRPSRVIAELRYERVDAAPPAGEDLFLLPGVSHVTSLGVAFARDTRPDPILPYAGDETRLSVELGDELIGDYRYLRARGRYARWFPVAGVSHVLSVHLAAGLVVGDAPRFYRFHPGDWNVLLAPRPLDLVVSTQPSWDFFGTDVNAVPYGEVAGRAQLEYSYRLFRRSGRIYGGDVYVGAGLFGLGRRGDLDRWPWPVDLVFDAGLRLDTQIGIFELGLANGIGRIPL